MKDRRALFLVWLGLLVMSVVFVVLWSEQTQQVETIPYSQFQELLRQGHIEQVVVGADDLHGSLTADELPKPQVELTGGSWRDRALRGVRRSHASCPECNPEPSGQWRFL